MSKIISLFIVLFLSVQVNAQDTYSHPIWAKNATIYEVNVRQFTHEGTFKALENHLPRLRKMGVDILWLMPIYPIGEKMRKGTLGSYYSVKDYQAVNPEFGTLSDFQHFVKTAHSLGFKVILDWVANHSAPDNFLVKQHPNWYTHDSLGNIIPPVPDWSDVADFNYEEKGLWDYQIESMKFWLKTADVDGFRDDVAMMVPLEFWKKCRQELDKVKPVFMLAEAEGPEFHRNGFDMTYGWELHHLLNEIAQGKKNASELDAYFFKINKTYLPNDYHLYFTSNHDENTWNGTEFERMGEAAQTMAALAAILPGMPLVYTGQESKLNKRLRFFDKDTIDWGTYPLAPFYTALLHLKNTHPALFNGKEGGSFSRIPSSENNLYAFSRKKGNKEVIGIFNLSKTAIHTSLNEKSMVGKYQHLFTKKEQILNQKMDVKLAPWEYQIWVK